jgi:D-alanyl-D-alanine-carboxypeptidase/D-alanyl-D-alanine-endopeptidase
VVERRRPGRGTVDAAILGRVGDRGGPSSFRQAVRLIDHAAFLYRDGLIAAVGRGEAGEMDAMGLGWVVMMPEGNHPLVLQKPGGLQGTFAYVALAPTNGVGVFFAMNAFDVAAFKGMVEVAKGLVTDLAPR